MDRIFKLPVGVAVFAALALAGLIGMFAVGPMQTAEAQSNNANLGSLSVSDGDKTVTLSPTFRADRFSYTGSVPNSTTSVVVTATAAQVKADVVGDGPWDISEGDGPYTRDITVYAEDGLAQRSYLITITKLPQNDDATLKVLTVTDDDDKTVTITPTFDAGTTNYTAEVANSEGTVTVKATANDENAAVTAETDHASDNVVDADNDAADADFSFGFALTEPANNADAGAVTTITITVTAEDTDVTERYIIRVTRNLQSDVADLDSLRITPGTTSRRPLALTPRFDAGITSYTAAVANDVGQVTLTAMAVENATINNTVTVSGGADDDGDNVAATAATGDVDDDNKWSGTVTLVAPATSATFTTITITVTAEDGDTDEAYIIVIERAPPSSDATLKILTLTDDDDKTVTLTPGFDPGTGSYTAEVANGVEMVTVKATANDENVTNVAPTTSNDADSGVTDTDDDADELSRVFTLTNPPTASPSFTTATITVTAQNSSTMVYTVVIERAAADSDATLRSLSVSPSADTLSPAFDKGILDYTAEVPYSVTNVAVMATPSNKYATVAVEGEEDGMVPLIVGVNVIDITVTPDSLDIASTTDVDESDPTIYTVRVTRQVQGAQSSDASLSELNLWDGTAEVGDLSESFMPGTMSYTVMADNDVESVTVAATHAAGASFMVNGSASRDVDLMVGDTEITVTVTAGDGTTMMTYMITVTRDADATPADQFDTDRNGMIDAPELNSAIRSYAAGDITGSELNTLIRRYAAGN